MADTSPGKVQVLRQMFAQKNEPVMGCMKPGTNTNRPWNRSSSSLSEGPGVEEKQRISPVSVTATQAMLRAIQTTDYKKPISNGPCDSTRKVFLKPSVGPKPTVLSQGRTFSSHANAFSMPNSSHVHSIHKSKTVTQRSFSECCSNSINKTETVASFMFGSSHKYHSDDSNNEEPRYRPLPTSKLPVNGTNKFSIQSSSNSGENMKAKNSTDVTDIKSHLNLINSDNYICKSRNIVRKKELPPKHKLGPSPLKPVKPPDMKLPDTFLNGNCNAKGNVYVKQPYSQEIKPVLPPKKGENNSAPVPQKPSYPCPPRPSSSPPIPPSQKPLNDRGIANTSQSSKPKTLLEEIEQIYADALSEDSCIKIPEYTEDEELGCDELYGDTILDDYEPNANSSPYSSKQTCPQTSSSSRQSLYLEPVVNSNHNTHDDTYYADTADPLSDGEIYQVMPAEEAEEYYSNNAKELEKTKREEEKRLRKEHKAKLKKEKEIEKLKKKFNFMDDELVIDSGLVKADSRGGRLDLHVKKGEIVDILRIEGNPVGKWLVKNKKGKYGYVELTNIEVDPDSVKSVMTIKRTSVISTSEELYNEAYSEQEGIYELTY